jgi:hypothetical protein
VLELIVIKVYVFATEQVQNFTSDPSALPEFSQLLRNQIETQVKPLSLPGISSIKGNVNDGNVQSCNCYNLLMVFLV